MEIHRDPNENDPAGRVLELLRSHRSIRRFTSDPVPDADIERAVAAGQMASTSSAVQAYCLIRVRDPGTRERLVPLTGGQQKVADCGAFFVVCGDVRRHRVACARDGIGYDARLEAFLVAAIDASLFAEKTVVAFEAMGYGVCYIGGLRNQLAEVRDLLEIPLGVYPLYGLCVGVPDESPSIRPRLRVASVLFEERYPDDDRLLAQMAEYDETYERYRKERGAEPARWSELMSAKYKTPARTHLAGVYRDLGADLD
ncbi:MAG: nitroreductase family protein [Planctomycetota bacterium]